MKARLSPRTHLFWLLLLVAVTDSAKAQLIELSDPVNPTGFPASFGLKVIGLSDWTGDGIGELAVSKFRWVYILNGKDFSVVHQIVSPYPNVPPSGFGLALAEMPDINGDRVPEIVIASERVPRADIFSGASGKILQTIKLPGLGYNTAAVAGLGTTRPNSVPTVAVSAPACCDVFEDGHDARIYIFNSVTAERLLTIQKPDDTPWFGVSLANIGDVDGDGRDDLAVGAGPPFYQGEGIPPGGAAYIVSGETGKVLHRLILPLPSRVDFRWDVAAVPDVNADGKTDVLVGIGGGARQDAPIQSGHAYLFSGADGKLLRSLVSPGQQEQGGFGWTVAGVPDVTGDGAGELLIAAAINPFLSGFQTYGEQKMYLVNGATGETIQSFTSPYVGESFGWSIAVLRGKEGKLRHLIAGVPREESNVGRVFAFPLRFLTAARSEDGVLVSLTATDENSYELQSSLDMKTWKALTTLKATAEPVTFLDKQSKESHRRFYRAEQTNTSP